MCGIQPPNAENSTPLPALFHPAQELAQQEAQAEQKGTYLINILVIPCSVSSAWLLLLKPKAKVGCEGEVGKGKPQRKSFAFIIDKL